MKTFDSLLERWMLDEENGEKKEDFPWKVSEEDVILLKEKVWHNKTLETYFYPDNTLTFSPVVYELFLVKHTCLYNLF
jgi:hypothetical protein